MSGGEETVTRVVDQNDDSELSNDWMLRGCTMVEHGGKRHPSLGKITLFERLGRGGMGVVYRGVHPRLGVDVAVKLLPPALEQAQQEFVDRFVREARIAAKLRSEHLVSVLDVDQDASTRCHFLVMEYVRGVTAGKWAEDVVAAGRAGVRESDALDVVIAATKGLAAAHAEGIVHRDVKPGNILVPVDADGKPALAKAKLADLGLARGEGGEGASLTGTQIALGTPGYMAPEQAQDAKTAKKPADVFAMGATLYALLAGVAPFKASTPVETLVRTMQGTFRPLTEVRPDVSAATATLVAKCLEGGVAGRYPDASALLRALEICRASLGAPTSDAAQATVRVAELAGVTELGKPAVTPVPAPASAALPRTVRVTVTQSPPQAAPLGPVAWTVAVGLIVSALAVVTWKSAAEKPAAPRSTARVEPATPPADRPPVLVLPERELAPDAEPKAEPKLEPKPETEKPAPRKPREDLLDPPKKPVPAKPVVETPPPVSREIEAKRPPPPQEEEKKFVPPPVKPARNESGDPVEAAQEFDLDGLPEGSFGAQQIQKQVRTHRRGDVPSALAVQRALATFYSRIGDTARARISRERADVLDRAVRDREAAAASAAAASKPQQPSQEFQPPPGGPLQLGPDGRPIPPPPPPGVQLPGQLPPPPPRK